MEIYTLGTSNRTLEEFLEILKEYKIETVVDVRHWPTSRLFPHFKKENLEKFLKKSGIGYFHFEKLGGYREGGYENYTKSEEFKEGLGELIKIAKNKKMAIICAEKFPWKCHRAFISQELEKKNFKVIHIIEKGRIWKPKRELRKIRPSCEKRLKKRSNILQNVRIL
jgi:uncharacterized protein (DUF488 family)